mmetsp:Transcript_22602/g.71694  ORF Transcript_22602/g.71694 Transcript_22602/m.71694 type:complete len:195 (+) Transcript_22602:86-670(+)
MSGLSLERLEPESWRRFREVQLRAMRDSPDIFLRPMALDEALGEEEWRLRISRGMTLVASMALAEGSAEDVGVASAAACPGRPGSATFGIWVTPEWRGKGLGGRLVDEVLSWARSAGFSRMVLHVPDDNEAAVGLYERKGFKATGVRGALPPPRSHVRKHEMALDLPTRAAPAGEEAEEAAAGKAASTSAKLTE